MSSKFDVIIIGSGLGGLECGVILSKEGYRVCVLEQADAFGGCLRSFERHGSILDTGIHYVGSLGQGEILNQFMKYFGVLDSLTIRRLDDDAFDVVNIAGDSYDYPHGHDRFYRVMADRFPHERVGLRRYCDKIRDIGERLSVEILHAGKLSSGGLENLNVAASDFIDSCISDSRLSNLLAGTNVLYAGRRGVTPLYHHAMINHSNIVGSYRFVNGTQQVADAFVKEILDNGGEVRNRSCVTSINVDRDGAESVDLANGERIEAKYIISSAHPAMTMGMVEQTPLIKKAYRTRFNSLANTYGLMTVYMLMKPRSYPYINKNLYYCKGDDVWTSWAPNQPVFALLSCQARSSGQEYCDVATLLSPMYISEFEKWTDTKFEQRGKEYENFKNVRAEQLIDFVAKYQPEIKECIDKTVVTTPLSYRDYTLSPEGSAYGIEKNALSPMTTFIPVRTRIPNLLLTGKNVNVHGFLGVTLTAALTCAEILGMEYIAKKVGTA